MTEAVVETQSLLSPGSLQLQSNQNGLYPNAGGARGALHGADSVPVEIQVGHRNRAISFLPVASKITVTKPN